ncbi:hypothetical protein [Aurantiacibacter sediminis]|uniref:DUF3617 family protein n=1 Tax=Aurantiacibacter sediminis TaxID=2793064 RepID=A0ABS0N3R5_9SPHN|nr:hypothetical protein [Aurantiacibacter sediminis]MBH5321866.1 hypothetical protein [Aurantiacibacter sediminis]
MIKLAIRCILLSPFAVLTACADQDDGGTQDDAPPNMSTPIGLYEVSSSQGGEGRFCVTGDSAQGFRFALVTKSTDNAACGGAGDVSLSQGTLRFSMTGDEDCEFTAQIEGTDMVFSAEVTESCAYYCSPEGSLAAARFTKTGDTREDAQSARDLVGDPLCR